MGVTAGASQQRHNRATGSRFFNLNMELSEENVPPTKKLKQATLSFFKTSAPSPKLTSAPIGIKRKLPSGPDSPNKLAKLSKPLAPVAVFNTESASATSASKG